MTATFDARLTVIAADRTHGAADLARRGLDTLAALAEASAGDPAEDRWRALAEGARRLSAARASMAPVANLAVAYLERLLPDREAASRQWARAAATAHDALAGALDHARAAQVEAARGLLAGRRRIVTLSRSSTVTAILTQATPAGAEIIVGESRPGLEGRLTADDLYRAGRRVRLVTDAALPHAIKSADLLLLGGDSICADLAVINKTGSLAAALAARHFAVTVWVAIDTTKINPRITAATAPLEAMDPGEVWPAHPDLAGNVYFEPVPADLIDGYLTEDGLVASAALGAAVAAWQRRYRAVGFDDATINKNAGRTDHDGGA